MSTSTYRPKGVCTRRIDVQTEGNKIVDVSFEGGCPGNLKAVSKLVKGMDKDEMIAVLEGNTCGRKSTSCADQLAQALKEL